MNRSALSCTFTAALITLTGCGPSDGRATLQGEVTLGGQPLPDGTIEFVPVEGTQGPTSGGVIQQGKYDIRKSGPLPGKYRVMITAQRKTGRTIETEALGALIREPETEQYIAARYNYQSELTIEITSGNNRHDFHMASDR